MNILCTVDLVEEMERRYSVVKQLFLHRMYPNGRQKPKYIGPLPTVGRTCIRLNVSRKTAGRWFVDGLVEGAGRLTI
jgi:hypothetical protein